MIPLFILHPFLLCSVFFTFLCFFNAPLTYAAEWESIQVPETVVESPPSPHEEPYITAWYRCWVKVPDSYFSKHERNLFEESVGVSIKDLVGEHEAWVNGIKIGASSSFRPNQPESLGILYRHKVPVGTLIKGQWNELAIKIHHPNGLGGFKGEAPFIMDYFLECVFEGEWEFLTDKDYSPAGALATRPNRAAFDSFHEAQRVLGRTEQVHGASLSPHASASRMQAVDDLQTELLLYEPTVTQPFHFTFDERGRLWVAQSRQYPYPAGIRMLSRDKYYRSHYDALPPAPPNHTLGADRITIHEDTNGDGNYDLHKTFVDGLNMANAAIRGHGGVWVMHTPYLLFYPDADLDDVPDGPPEVRLTGFGFEDSHSIANGLVWGPDGWLYGGQGSTCSCRITRPGIDPPDSTGVYFEGCMVWRYHPTTKEFEIFAEGGGNTYGLEFDAEGRLYSGHNGGSTRGWHFVQGGFYQMQGVNPGKFGPPRNPYAFGDLPMMSSPDRIVRFTHFGAFAEGTAIPDALRGMLFAIDPLHNEVIASERQPRGATFITQDHGVVVKSSDPAFRPVHIANAPDGSLMVSDMYEYYIAHGQHYQNQIDPTTGRIYRISGMDEPRETDTDLTKKTNKELIMLLGHANKWHRQTAVRLIAERKDPQTISPLRQMAVSEVGLSSLNALWALYQVGGFDASTVQSTLQHPDAHVRLWTVRLLGDHYGIQRNLGLPGTNTEAQVLPEVIFNTFLNQTQIEPHPEVRSQIASTARRLELTQGLLLTEKLLEHEEDLDDLFIPLLCWWMFEAHMPDANEGIVQFMEQSDLWSQPVFITHVLPRVARRLAVDGKRRDLLLLTRLIQNASSTKVAAALTRGFEEAYRGRTIAGLPDELVNTLANSHSTSRLMRLKQGDQLAIREALEAMGSGQTPLDERLLYIRAFGEIQEDGVHLRLLKIAETDPNIQLRKAAFVSLNAYSKEEVINGVIKLIPNLEKELMTAAFTLILSRESWVQASLNALDSGHLKNSMIPYEITENLRLHRNDSIRNQAIKLLPKSHTVTEGDKNVEIAEIETILKAKAGNPYAGEPIYMERCATCHKLFFKGGSIGPDLTSYQRNDLGTMLMSIVNPNAEIREGYQFIHIETKDGRQLSGFESDRDHQVHVLRLLDGQDITIPVKEIKDVDAMGRSMMPEGLLKGLTHQQLRDLFAYLRISQPIRN